MEHKQAQAGRWAKFTTSEQMANIGSEVERTILWKNKNNRDYGNKAFERALELLDLTVQDNKNKSRNRYTKDIL